MDYTTLSLADVRTELEAIAVEADTAFGRLDARQLNWKPEASRWSVAQCLEHLLTANGQMAEMADQALDGTRRRTLWQRLPVWPGLLGRMLDPHRRARTRRAGSRRRARRSRRPAPSTPGSSAASSISSAP